jgi:hypothetical protein
MHFVQIRNRERRAVAVTEGLILHLLEPFVSVYELALNAIRREKTLAELAQHAASGKTLNYDSIYEGDSEWRLLLPLDHPTEPTRVMVSGTGLTHKVGAENRAAMHRLANSTVTDSMRMYQLGKDGGRPVAGGIGAQPEWFYKGNGSILKAHMEHLVVPGYANDGGEEPEIAGAYLIADDGKPYRLGFMTGNEFSDHVMEKQNYLYLAPSKLRSCSLGPELVVGDKDLFADVAGTVAIERQGAVIWGKNIHTGETNMCHSLANLEHHQFKYDIHRRPGDVHIHFFGADTFSFGENIQLKDGDIMEVSFPAFGRPLRNPLRVTQKNQTLVQVRSLV